MLSRRFLRVKVIKGLYSHFKSESDSLITSEKNMMYSIDKAYELYFQMLALVADVKRYAEERIELAKQKKLPTREDLNPNYKFVRNRLIGQIESDEKLEAVMTKKSLGWSRYPELIKHLYNQMLASDYYKAYMASDEDSWAADKKLVEDFYVTTVQDNEMLETVLEEQSIMWNDDLDYILVMIVFTIEKCRSGLSALPLQRQYKSEDDVEFVKELYRRTVVNFADFQQYIERFTVNWDLERIAFIDNLIMAAAMAELIYFDSIPVKVTMDEYIEISKYYSTPGSSVFVNGVLDKIVDALRSEGKINKVGRGLLE